VQRTQLQRSPRPRCRMLGLVAMLLLGTAAASRADTVLTREDVRSRAVEFNRTYLSAREDVNLAEAEIGTAFSDALPQVTVGADYTRNIKSPSFFFFDETGNATAISTSTDNAWDASISVRQPLWNIKVVTAYSIAKLYRDYSNAVADQVRDQVIEQADVLFYSTVLERSRLDVLQQALENNTANLDVVQKKFDQGLVSEYEVLRARVERSNLLPQIIEAESNVRLSEKRLKSYIGIDLEEPVRIDADAADTSITGLPPVADLIATALSRRPEVVQSDTLELIAQKGVNVARADYWPTLDAFTAYNWQSQSDRFTLKENNSRSWTAGLTLSYPIFEGGRTRAKVGASKAQYNQAKLSSLQVRDNVRLEVEAAYDRLLQAKKSLDIQGNTIAQAEEGLRIARLRYESGVGTQLEVLSAQTALTSAQQALAEALFGFRSARAGLARTTTMDIDSLTER